MMSGDWIPVSLPDRIKALVHDIEVVSLGGATEASIWSILYPIKEVDPDWKSIPYGGPMWNQSWQVLNERLEPCPVWTVGELYIGGIGLAKGYWRDEQKTARSFITHPRSGERLYRTGDLGRYLPDGNIEFLGREDSQVKIQGYRIELGEIEAALEEHEDVRTAVVNAFGEQRGSKRLIGYVVPEQRQPASSELQLHLKAKLPEYMIPTTFMFLDKLPLSSNGKVDRRALPEPERVQQDESSLVAPGNWKEQALVDIWSKVLGLEQIGINDNFFELGGDSILSIRVAAQASEAGLRLTPDQIFQYRTIAELSCVIDTTEVVQAEQGIITGNVPLTPIQHWFFEHDFTNPEHWNQALLLEVRQTLDPALIKQAVERLLAHHDALRLRFVRDENGWSQESVGVPVEVPVSGHDLSALTETQQTVEIERIAAETQASLGLAHGPVLRLVTFHLGAGKPGRLLIVIHHLVVDGVSWRILLDDLERTYDALKRDETVALPPKTTSYQQWAEKLNAEAESGTFDDEIGYWTNVLQQAVPPLPLDNTGENTAESAHTVTMSLTERETRALLYEVAETYHTQINEVLLTALAEGFRRWTGERRVLVDVEGHGREAIVSTVDLARTVGWFTAIYPVQLALPVVWEPGSALKQIKEQLRTVPRAGVGFGILKYPRRTEELRSIKAPVSFNYLGQLDQVVSGSSLYHLAPESAGPPYSPLGKRTHLLAFYGSVFGGQFQLRIEYSRNVHRQARIEKLADNFITALRALITHCTSGETFSYTPSDFPLISVDQEQLDKAFSLVEFEE
jgi:non-ribosomal peptide synthase protein (TIGR01720 family)